MSNGWIVVLDVRRRLIWAGNLGRLIDDALCDLREKKNFNPFVPLGISASAKTADRIAAGFRGRVIGFDVIDGSAEYEERRVLEDER
jgi:hypothetical protein